MRAKERRRLRWLQPWLDLGYTVTYGRSGHYKVLDPEGRYVATVSASPRNPRSPEYEAERVLRRYHDEQNRTTS